MPLQMALSLAEGLLRLPGALPWGPAGHSAGGTAQSPSPLLLVKVLIYSKKNNPREQLPS